MYQLYFEEEKYPFARVDYGVQQYSVWFNQKHSYS